MSHPDDQTPPQEPAPQLSRAGPGRTTGSVPPAWLPNYLPLCLPAPELPALPAAPASPQSTGGSEAE